MARGRSRRQRAAQGPRATAEREVYRVGRSIRRLLPDARRRFRPATSTLGYWQVVAADGLKDRRCNEQTAQAHRLVDRGRTISADGKMMAASRAAREGRRRCSTSASTRREPRRADHRLHVRGRRDRLDAPTTATSRAASGPAAAPPAPKPEREGGGERSHEASTPACRRWRKSSSRTGRGVGRGAGPQNRERRVIAIGLVADLLRTPAARGRRLRPRSRGRAGRAEPGTVQGLYAPGPPLQDRDRVGGPRERDSTRPTASSRAGRSTRRRAGRS